MMKRYLYTALLTLTAWVFIGSSNIAAQISFPPIAGSHIIDDANILSVETKTSLDLLIQQHEDSSGNQILVLTIPTLGDNEIAMYANEAYNHYNLGQKGTNNGVLLLIAHEDHKLRIEVGYGLEGNLPDALCGRIIDNEIVPSFKAGDFDGGVTNGVNAILQAIQGTYVAPEGASETGLPWWLPFLFVFGSIGFIIIMGVIKGKGGGSGFGGGGFGGGYYGGGWSSGGGGWSGGGGGGWSGGGGGFSGGGGASGSW